MTVAGFEDLSGIEGSLVVNDLRCTEAAVRADRLNLELTIAAGLSQ